MAGPFTPESSGLKSNLDKHAVPDQDNKEEETAIQTNKKYRNRCVLVVNAHSLWANADWVYRK